MWEAWQLSKTLRTRPSELYGISHPVTAYFFDRAVSTFGQAVDADLEEASSKATKAKKAEQARQRVLEKWLGIEPTYKDPGAPKRADEQLKKPEAKPVVSDQDGPVTL